MPDRRSGAHRLRWRARFESARRAGEGAGQRVEPEKIEFQLMAQPGVKQAAVVLRDGRSSLRRGG